VNKKLKVLHVISQRPDSTGSGIYLQAMIRESAAKGHENYLIAALPQNTRVELSGIKPENCCFVYFDTGQSSEIIGMSDVMPYPSRTFKDLDSHGIKNYLNTFVEPLTHMVSGHHPDIIHSHHLWLLSSFIKKQYPKLPLITSCHGSDLRQFNQCPHLREHVLDGCSDIDRVLALSTDQKNEIVELYQLPGEKVSVAGSGYDRSIFFPAAAMRDQKVIRLVYAGKISRAKGIPWLIQALSRVKRTHYHLDLVGGGSGKEYDECREAAAVLGDHASFHGMVSQQTLANLLRQSRFFILPSLHEGLPLVILEALACGCTVIATELPGTREIRRRLQTNRLILVPSPRVIDTNTTRLADDELFTNSLKMAIEQAIELPIPDHDTTADDLSYFSWQSVFSRVEQSWLNFS